MANDQFHRRYKDEREFTDICQGEICPLELPLALVLFLELCHSCIVVFLELCHLCIVLFLELCHLCIVIFLLYNW